MATDESELLKDLKRRRKSMDDEYNHWEPLFRDLRDNIIPNLQTQESSLLTT